LKIFIFNKIRFLLGLLGTISCLSARAANPDRPRRCLQRGLSPPDRHLPCTSRLEGAWGSKKRTAALPTCPTKWGQLKTDPDNEPIYTEDFAMIPDVLRDPDKVIFHERSEREGSSLEYRRRINGWLVVIQMISGEVGDLKELQFKTMWKEIGKRH
jgi:hypothetical protein